MKDTVEIDKDEQVLSKLSMDEDEILPVDDTKVVINKKETLKLPCINPMSVYPDPLDQIKNYQNGIGADLIDDENNNIDECNQIDQFNYYRNQ